MRAAEEAFILSHSIPASKGPLREQIPESDELLYKYQNYQYLKPFKISQLCLRRQCLVQYLSKLKCCWFPCLVVDSSVPRLRVHGGVPAHSPALLSSSPTPSQQAALLSVGIYSTWRSPQPGNALSLERVGECQADTWACPCRLLHTEKGSPAPPYLLLLSWGTTLSL